MKKLIRLFRLRAQIRYWRKRALQAEVALKLETWRNREREDTFASAAIMGSRGMFGVAARSAPAAAPMVPQKAISGDPWDALPVIDKMEFDTFWKDAAEAAGVPLAQARQKFIAEVVMPRRMPMDGMAN